MMKTVRARVSSSKRNLISQAKIERDQRNGLPPPLVRAPLRAVPLVPDAPPRPAGDESEQEQRRRAAQGAGGGILPGEGGRHAVQDSGRPRRRPGHAPGHEPGAREPGPRHPGRRVRQGPEDVRRRREATRRGTRFATTKRETKPTEQNLFFMSLYLSRGKERRERATESGRGVDEARARRTVEDRALISLTEGRTDGYIITSRVSVRVPRSSRSLRQSAPRSVARASLIRRSNVLRARTSRTRVGRRAAPRRRR